MMGKDVERILSGINLIKDVTRSSINSLANGTSYRIKSKECRGCPPPVHCYPLEEPYELPATVYVSPIRAAMQSISSDYAKMNSLASMLYTSTSSFNNCYGSPWTELNRLEDDISSAEAFAAAHPTLPWVGDKAGLLALLNKILTSSIDAKWAITHYHDYIQRGYDNVYNNNDPSITFNTSLDGVSIGNINQVNEENVHIKPKSNDPF